MNAWLLFWKLPLGAPPLLADCYKAPAGAAENPCKGSQDDSTGSPTASTHRCHEGQRSCLRCPPRRSRLLRSRVGLPICLGHHTLLLCLHLPPTAPCPPPGVLLHQQQVLHASSRLNHPKEPSGVCQSREEMGAGDYQRFGDELEDERRLEPRTCATFLLLLPSPRLAPSSEALAPARSGSRKSLPTKAPQLLGSALCSENLGPVSCRRLRSGTALQSGGSRRASGQLASGGEEGDKLGFDGNVHGQSSNLVPSLG